MPHVYRIAHVSDLHVLSRTGAAWRSIVFNKRITGYANLLLSRGRVHRRDYLEKVLDEASRNADHLVVTGDITNLALEHEYESARGMLEAVARRVELTTIPGNHDIYLPSTQRHRRFAHHFGAFLHGDLPQLACDLPTGSFPCVKLRGPVAIVALSSGVPRPPFVSGGHLGLAQLDALDRVLAHAEVRCRMPVVLVHHPPMDQRASLLRLRDGLADAPALLERLSRTGRGLVLFGHLHRRMQATLRTPAGHVAIVGASGAALDHADDAVRAGYNVYRIDAGGTLADVAAYVIDAATGTLRRSAIPAAPAAFNPLAP